MPGVALARRSPASGEGAGEVRTYVRVAARGVPTLTGGLEVYVVLQMLVLIAPVVFLPVIMLLAWVEEVVSVVPPDEVP